MKEILTFAPSYCSICLVLSDLKLVRYSWHGTRSRYNFVTFQMFSREKRKKRGKNDSLWSGLSQGLKILGACIAYYYFVNKVHVLWESHSRPVTYRVFHIEMDETKWLWGIERSIILLNLGAQWLQEIWTFEFHPPIFKELT